MNSSDRIYANVQAQKCPRNEYSLVKRDFKRFRENLRDPMITVL